MSGRCHQASVSIQDDPDRDVSSIIRIRFLYPPEKFILLSDWISPTSSLEQSSLSSAGDQYAMHHAYHTGDSSLECQSHAIIVPPA